MSVSSANQQARQLWLNDLCAAIEPELKERGFARHGLVTFKRRHKTKIDQLSLSISPPLMSDDSHAGYVAAFVAVQFPDVQAIERRLDDHAARLKLSAVGGNLGLYGPKGSYTKWAVDDQASTLRLTTGVLSDLECVAEPFWRSFPDVKALAELLDSNHRYTFMQQHRWCLRVALNFVAHGPECALEYVSKRPEKFQEYGGVTEVRKRLESFRNP